MILFFDTSALVKFYQEEEGTELVTKLILKRGGSLIVSELSRLEFIAALMRRYRSGELDRKNLDEAISGFNDDLKRFIVYDLDAMTIKKAAVILREYGGDLSLRTIDAIQLAAFQSIKGNQSYFVTSDRRLESVALKVGAKTINLVQQAD